MENSNAFLPDDFEVKQSNSNYMKLQDGENKFRPLSSSIVGWEYWKADENGKEKPVRVRKGDSIPMGDVSGDPDKVRQFIAFVVFDYADERIKILSITQLTIQKQLKALAQDKDWGSPIGAQGYDIMITKSGKGLDTEYSVNPKPKKTIDGGIIQACSDMNINLQALFNGGDPFNSDPSASELADDAVKAGL
jgi:hypothetical protein